MNDSALLANDQRVEQVLATLDLPARLRLLSGDSTWTVAAQADAGIPALKLCDGPNAARGDAMRGVPAAAFPVGTAMASTWNESLIEAVGRALGEEAHTKGVHVLLGPTINLQRHPFGGRNFECYSEDPLQSGRIACAFIRGVQSQGVAACAKHFVANDAEEDRHHISSVVDERTLHEFYLRPFELAVREADVWTVMSSYNRVNGVYASSHEPLLRTLLKDRWGFAGLVVSDWGAALETVANLRAGLDLEMPGPTRTRGQRLLDAVEAGEIEEAWITDCARRVLRVIDQTVGLTTPGALLEPVKETAVDSPAHRTLAREVARQAMVLLRNERDSNDERLLPLNDTTSLAVIGPNAEPGQIQGGGSSQVFPHYQVSPLAGLEQRFGKVGYGIGVRNHKYIPVPPQNQVFLPGAEDNGIALTLYANPEGVGDPLYERTLSARVSPWGFLPLGLPGREDSPFDDSDGFSATLRFDYLPSVSGRHAIGLQSAGLARLFVNDEELIDNWTSQEPGDAFFGRGSTEQRAETQCNAGERIEVRIEFRSNHNAFLQGVRYGIEPWLLSDDALMDEAEALARSKDACVLVVGSNSDWETEGNDRRDLALPCRQDELIERILAVNPNTVVVVNSGAPVSMPWFEHARAVLQAWLPGQEFGHALADPVER